MERRLPVVFEEDSFSTASLIEKLRKRKKRSSDEEPQKYLKCRYLADISLKKKEESLEK